MWTEPKNSTSSLPDINAELLLLKGELPDDVAQVTLAKFLRNNLKFTTFLLTGIRLAPYQSILINSWFKRSFCLNVLGRGCGKSTAYSSDSHVIVKDRGLISLTELFPDIDFSQGECWMDFDPIELWNGTSWQITTRLLVQPMKSCSTMTTRYGYSLTGSTNHLIKIYNPETHKVEWKRYHEIKIGDWACISRNQVPLNFAMTDEADSYFLGLMIGDGCYAPSIKHMSFTSGDQELLDFVATHTNSVSRIEQNSTNSKNVHFTTAFSQAFLAKYGVAHSLSYDKYIPTQLFTNSANLAACLRGLFDTDGGYEKNGTVTFCSTSIRLARQVQTALLTFGIVARLKRKITKSDFGQAWVVIVSGHNVDAFVSKVGFGLGRKQTSIVLGKKRNTNSDVVPEIMDYCEEVKTKMSLSKSQAKEWHDKIQKRDQNNLSYPSLRKHIEFLKAVNAPQEDVAILEQIEADNFFFDPVERIDHLNHHCVDFNVPDGEMYWTNGFISHNTFSAGVFALLYAIFHPNENVLVVSATFRSSRRILEAIEKLAKSPGGKLLFQTFNRDLGTDGMTRRGDMFTINFGNGSSISAVPLGNSEKLRGLRCSVLILDEGLLIPETTITSILMPFLSAAVDIPEKMKIRQIEDRLIKSGKLKEENRKVFKSAAKLIMLSSASYTFEYLYTMYQSYLKKIDEGQDDGKYFVAQLSYEVVPEHLLDKAVIDEMKEMSESMVDREMRAKFTDGSAGYFSAKKMKMCTITDGQTPIIEVVGVAADSYVLGIDPSFSSAEHSDHFAMSVMKIVEKDGRKIGMLVHSYAVAGGDLKDHILYLYYLLKNFNIVYIAIDSSQGDNNEFINSCNNSQLFKLANIELKDIDADFHKEDMIVLPAQIRKSYNLQDRRIVQKQSFNSYFQRAANEYLQACFDHLNILFAGRVKAIDNATERLSLAVPEYLLDPKTGHTEFKKEGSYDFVGNQDDLIDLTKNECALIQISSSALGNQSWDLAQSIRRSKNPKRARKDNYSSLLLANWALKLYIESQSVKPSEGPPDFNYKLI